MRFLALIFMALMAVCICATSVSAQTPPVAVPLEKVIKNADAIFIGRLNSARTTGDRINYEFAVDRIIAGAVDAKCLVSKYPYKIGADYIFFVRRGKRTGCAIAGDYLPAGLELSSIGGQRYVKFTEPRLGYPDFGKKVFSLTTIPMASVNSITLWQGVAIAEFEKFIRKSRVKTIPIKVE